MAKNLKDMLLHTLECIVNVKDGCCAYVALNMHQMGNFTLLIIFILELFLTRETKRVTTYTHKT